MANGGETTPRVDQRDRINVREFAECMRFCFSWLGWRKWLRASGIVEWATKGALKEANNEASVLAPLWQRELIDIAQFDFILPRSQLPEGMPARNRLFQSINRTRTLVEYEQEWAAVNARAFIGCRRDGGTQSARAMNLEAADRARFAELWPGKVEHLFLQRDSLNADLVRLVARELYELEQRRSLRVAGNALAVIATDKVVAEDERRFVVDDILRTFSDHTLATLADVVNRCEYDETRRVLFIVVPNELGEAVSVPLVRIRSGEEELMRQFDPTIRLLDLRGVFNPFHLPAGEMVLQQSVRRIGYTRLVLKLADELFVARRDQIGATGCANVRDLEDMAKLTNLRAVRVVRFRMDWSETRGEGNEDTEDTGLFAENGLEWPGSLLQAMAVLVDVHRLSDARFTQTDRLDLADHTFTVCMTSCHIDAEAIPRKDRERIGLSPLEGAFLRYDKYLNVALALWPSNRSPRSLSSIITDESVVPYSKFMRLVVIRLDNPSYGGALMQSDIDLGNAVVVCQFLRDIVRFFDPELQRVDEFVRIDPLLSDVRMETYDTGDAPQTSTEGDVDCECGYQLASGLISASCSVPLILVEDERHHGAYGAMRLAELDRHLMVKILPQFYAPFMCEHLVSTYFSGCVPPELSIKGERWLRYTLMGPRVGNKWAVATHDRALRRWAVYPPNDVKNVPSPQDTNVVYVLDWEDVFGLEQYRIHKLISKRLYTIDGVLCITQLPIKLCTTSGTKFPRFVGVVGEANFGGGAQSDRDVSCSLDRVLQLGHKMKSKRNDAIDITQTPYFYVLRVYDSHLWVPKVSLLREDRSRCFEGVPSTVAPLANWLCELVMSRNFDDKEILRFAGTR